MKIVIIKKWFRRKKWHCRIVADNGRIMFSSAPQYNRKDLSDTIKSLKEQLPTAKIIEEFNY